MLNLSTIRSVLFVPGNRPDRVSKALASPADLVCIDLEDSVLPESKPEARNSLLQTLARGPTDRLAVRVNAVTTRAGLEDLLALSGAEYRPMLVFVPKVQAGTELTVVAGAFGPACVAVVPLIESAEGLGNADDIARTPGCVAVMFGGADFAADIGATTEWDSLLLARSLIVRAAARARIPAIDVPLLSVNDSAGLADETRRARALGFTAKAAIHPSQLEAIHRIFHPTTDEVSQARAALAAFHAAGSGVMVFNGKMLDAPVVRHYERILSLASADRMPPRPLRGEQDRGGRLLDAL